MSIPYSCFGYDAERLKSAYFHWISPPMSHIGYSCHHQMLRLMCGLRLRNMFKWFYNNMAIAKYPSNSVLYSGIRAIIHNKSVWGSLSILRWQVLNWNINATLCSLHIKSNNHIELDKKAWYVFMTDDWFRSSFFWLWIQSPLFDWNCLYNL